MSDWKNCAGCGQAYPAQVYVYDDGLCAMCNMTVLTYGGNPLIPEFLGVIQRRDALIAKVREAITTDYEAQCESRTMMARDLELHDNSIDLDRLARAAVNVFMPTR